QFATPEETARAPCAGVNIRSIRKSRSFRVFSSLTRVEPPPIGHAWTSYTRQEGGSANDGNHDDIARPSVRCDETDRVRQEHRAEVAGGREAREASAGRRRPEVPHAPRWSARHLLDYGDPVRLRRVHPAGVLAGNAAGRIDRSALTNQPSTDLARRRGRARRPASPMARVSLYSLAAISGCGW